VQELEQIIHTRTIPDGMVPVKRDDEPLPLRS